MAEQLKKIRPRIRIIKPQANGSEGKKNQEHEDQFAEGVMAVVENPVFTELEFNQAKRDDEEVNIAGLLEANSEQSGLLTLVSQKVSRLDETEAQKFQVPQISKD